jgi:uncharacterized protein YjbI with pentapeptide repeats
VLHSIGGRVNTPLKRHLLLILLLLILTVTALLAVFAIRERYLLATLAVVFFFDLWALILWKVPKRQASGVNDLKDRLTVENATRQTLAQILGGILLIAGLVFTWANFDITQQNLDVTQQNLATTQDIATKNLDLAKKGQITDRYTKAIAQLGEQGSEKLAVRLGGIYTLEQIAQEQKNLHWPIEENLHWPIMEILTAYLRTHRPRSPLEPLLVAAAAPRPPKFTIDIEAVLTALKRRNTKNEEKGTCLNWRSTNRSLTNLAEEGACLYWRSTDRKLTRPKQKGACLNLRSVDLTLANLHEAELTRAQFASAHLKRAYLWKAQLQWAEFYGAKLEGALFREAELQSACFWRADLRNVDFFKAQLPGADLREANLWGANFSEANVEGADVYGALLGEFTTIEPHQLAKLKNLHQAHIHPSLREKIQREQADLLNPPVHLEIEPPPPWHNAKINSIDNVRIQGGKVIQVDQEVREQIAVGGDAALLPRKTHLWLAVEQGDRVWPKDHPDILVTGPDSTWAVTVYEEGVPEGDTFELVLYIVNDEGHERIREWIHIGNTTDTFPAFSKIPGSTGLQRISGLRMQKR